ncbi:hypothetical protein TRFO_41011 [Tritrichomonas foetus]|uniref:UBA domain-containing protein n=1 Tax=Tritrichomonas foetus TaxID=1144522 RepID=A0A1J4J680_9EUKA|nr:hypothetical protein TRFO_41011 [Tritrichomonas foetus]|eukprot:OHS92684.1 hypothetical protein TRFO_41011 [Tritrichomonas foetus]
MQLHLIDCQSFDQTIDVTPPITVHELLVKIKENYNYDTTLCSIFQLGRELEYGEQLIPENFQTDNVLVLFNRQIFREKSYPKVDHAFNFPPTRFQGYYSDINSSKLITNSNPSTNIFQNMNFESSYYNYLQSRIDPEYTIPVTHSDSGDAAAVHSNASSAANNNFQARRSERQIEGDLGGLNVDLQSSDLPVITRLCALGFDRLTAVQCYIVCDRNEEQARALLQSI